MLKNIIKQFLIVLSLSIVMTFIVHSSGQIKIDSSIYFAFTLIFFTLFLSMLKRPSSSFFSLINIFLFLGFWGKTTLYAMTSRRPGEAAAGGAILAEELNTSMVEVMGIIISLLVAQFLLKNKKMISIIEKIKLKGTSPQNKIPFILSFVGIVLVAFINYKLKFFRVGVASESQLPSIITPFFYWILGPGAPIIILLFSPLHYSWTSTLIIGFSMLITSFSTISRNTMMYYAFPVFINFFLNLYQWKKAVVHSFASFLFFVLTIFLITQGRRSLYYNENISLAPSQTAQQPEPTRVLAQNAPVKKGINWQYTRDSLLEVFIDRWIGIEGVIVAKKNQSDENFIALLQENQKVSPVSKYHQFSNSHYPTPGKFLFYTFPGPIGLITFAKSISLKITSYAVFVLVLLASYFLIEIFFEGLAKFAVSWWAASSMTQISIFPILNSKIYLFYFTLAIIAAWLIRSNFIRLRFSSRE